MKFTTYVAIAATLFAVASAVTMTTYSDAACKTAVVGSAAMPNPFVANLNTCTKYSDTIYVKATACGGGKVTSRAYTDATCATGAGAESTSDTDKCVAGGGASQMITCASTSSVTMAFLAVAAAVLALSF